MTNETQQLQLPELLRRQGRVYDDPQQPFGYALGVPTDRLGFCYPRQSKTEQVENNIWSRLRQLELPELAAQHGFKIVLSKAEVEALRARPDYPGWYQDGQVILDERDLGISGTLGRLDREALDHLIELIVQNIVGVIFVVEISRLWRDKLFTGRKGKPRRTKKRAERTVVDYNNALEFGGLCRDHGVVIVTPYRIFDMRTDSGFEDYVNECHKAARDLIVMQQRMFVPKVFKALAGYYVGGPTVPTGYMLEPDPERVRRNPALPPHYKFAIYEPHAELCREIVQQYVTTNGSVYAVVRWARKNKKVFPLFPEEIRTVMEGRSALMRNQPGPEGWAVSDFLVRSIVENPFYMGIRIYAGKMAEAVVPVIVSEPLMLKSLALAADKQPQKRGEGASAPPPPFSNLIYCYNHEEPRRVSYSGNIYACHEDYRQGLADHQCLAVTRYIVERPLLDVILTRCSYPEHVDEVIEQLKAQTTSQRTERNTRETKKRDLRRQIDNLQGNINWLQANRDLSDPSAQAHWESMTKDKAVREKMLSDLENVADDPSVAYTDAELEQVRAFVASLKTDWDLLDPELQHEFLVMVIEQVQVRHNKSHIWCRILWKDGTVQELVIHRPYVDFRVPWTEEELAILKEHYPTAQRERLVELLPQRTWVAIYRQGQTIGLKRTVPANGGGAKPRWQPWEDDLIRRYYDAEITKVELQDLLPDRAWCSIKTRANRVLDLHWVKRQPWEPNLRWESVPEGTLSHGQNVTTVLDNLVPSTRCRRAPS